MTTAWERWRRRLEKLRTHPRPVRLLVSRVLWHTGLSPLLTMPVGDGLSVRFYASSISAALWLDQESRDEDVDVLRLVLRHGDTYVDCGANIGHLAIIARGIVGADSAVTAIEANPRIFGYCVGNLRLNGFTGVRAVNVALGENSGSIEISDRRDDDQNRVGGGNGRTGGSVPMRPLDELLEPKPITLLKIDVEGYELFVLRGAARALATAQVVYCELSTSNMARFGYRPEAVEQVLLDAGFVCARKHGDAWRLFEGGVFSSLAAEELPPTGYNLLAMKRAVIPEMTARFAARGVQLTTGTR